MRTLKKQHVALLAGGLICILLGSSWACGKMGKEKPPNILVIMTDDQGYGDLSSHGNRILQTPHLDSLGAASVRFTNFHVATTCAPTRAGLLTGVHCNRTGTWHTVMGRSFLTNRFPTIAELLAPAGYENGIFGKWHLGDNYPYRPQDRGFTEVLIHGGGGVGQTPDYWNNDYYDDTYFHNGKPKPYPGYCTDVWFDEATDFMQATARGKSPFFCYISTNAPHSPHHAPEAAIAPYRNFEEVVNPNFYGQIAHIDTRIGTLMDTLAATGVLENTIVVFLTDNGTAAGVSLDRRQYPVNGYNAGMRGKKGSAYEGGHRVPLFIRFPTSMEIEQRTIDDLVAYTDLTPTLLDFALAQQEAVADFDGLSLRPLLETGEQDTLKARVVIVDTQRDEAVKKWKRTSVMQGFWRLVNQEELYRVDDDPGQRVNLIKEHPEMVDSLQIAYESWWGSIQSDVQTANRIVIGANRETVRLTAHDWHSPQDPPWHQRHIRAGKTDQGAWWLNVEKAGTYQLKLFRWPPESGLALIDGCPAGEEVAGGQAYLAGEAVPLAEGMLRYGGTERKKPARGGASINFEVDLAAGPLDLEAFLVDDTGLERGAYYVEIDLLK